MLSRALFLYCAVSLVIISLFYPMPSVASNQDSNRAWVRSYLSGFNNLVADFDQYTSGHKSGYGKVFIARGGKIRVEYFSVPLTLIINSGSVVIHDILLGNVSRHNLNYFDFLSRDIKGAIFESDLDRITMSFVRSDKKIKVIFSKKPAQIIALEILEPTGEKRFMEIFNVQHNAKLDDSLFEQYPKKKDFFG